MRAALLVVLLVIGIVAVPLLPRAHAASGTYFDNIVVIAMENRAYTEVIGNSNAPFINSIIPLSATLQHYNSYGAAGRSVNGCSAGCYTSLVSGSDQGISDGYGCCITAPTLMDSMGTAGLNWQAYCESGCPRGNDHFPFTGFASTASSPTVFTGGSVSPSDLIAAASSASPPNLLWYTPTDNNNMHDGSVSTGDSYIQNFLVGAGSLSSPAPGSLLASSLFQAGHRTLFLLWWDECAKGSFGCDSNNSTPNVWFGPTAGIKTGLSSTSTVYDEYSILHLIENNWALPTLAANDAAAAPMTEIFGSSTPPPLTTSFTTSPSTPIVNLPVTFTATTTGGKSPYTISWNFGDGSTGTGASILHTFLTAQSFIVTETATDSSSPSQTATSSKTVTIQPPPPLSTSFTFLPTNPTTNTPVSFTATTTGGTSPYTISWNFGDGTLGTGAMTSHTYTTAQSFKVTENATDSSSPSKTVTISTTVIVSVPPPPSTSFTFLPSSPIVNSPVTFTATTTGGAAPYSVSWNFGDGGSGTGASLVHTFASAQSFTVTETATDSSSPSKTATSSATVIVLTVPPLSTSFTFLPTSPLINTAVSFTAVTTGGTLPYTISWSFGDGSTGTGSTATHTYAATGTFSATLTVVDSGSPTQTASSIHSITVSPTAPGTVTLNFEGFDFDGQNEVTLTLNGVVIARYWSVANPANGQTWVPISLTITVVQGANTLVFTHANTDCAVDDNIRNLQVIDGTQVLFSDPTVHTQNCTTSATYNFNVGRVPPTLTIPGNQTVTAGTWINFTIVAASVNIGGTISLSTTGLPAGASFDRTTGFFSWRPSSSQVGHYTVVFTATDGSYPSSPTSQPMGIQVSRAAPGGSNGGNGGSGGSSNGGCLFCGVIPKISTSLGLLMIGGLLGLVASLALLTIKARASLEQTKRRMNRLTRED